MTHWHLRLTAALCLLSVFAFVEQGFGQQLQQLRSEVRVSDPAPPSRSSNHDDDDDHRYDDGSCDLDDDGLSGDELVGLSYLSGIVLTSPYWIPISAAGDNWGRMGYFPAHPYQYDVGYMIVHPDEYSGIRGPLLKFPWAVRARSDAGTNFAGLNWVGGNVLVESTLRFGIESDFRFYQEDLFVQPATIGSQVDTAWLGDANVFIRFAQSEKMQMRSGIGINWLSDRQHSDVGFNFTYAGDFYPIEPWVISGEFDWGLLGDETLLHARVTTGLQYKGLEAYVGYDFVDIGKFQQNSMILGVRLWF
jgi:hypothetical protein